MKTSSCKAKGRELQKHAAKRIQEIFDLPEEDAVSRPMGSSGIDVMLSRQALDRFPISLECKNQKSFPSLAALEQAEANRKKRTWAAVLWKPPGKGMNKSIVYMTFEDFLSIFHHLGGLEREDE